MSLGNADRDSARVTAVMQSLGQAGVPSPVVEAVELNGPRAVVWLLGKNGLRASVQLSRDGGHWRVTEVAAA